MRALWIVLAAGCFLVLALGILTTNLARSVLPGLGSGSTSMAPTSITMLFSPSVTQVNDTTAIGSTYQWNLTLPRAYIASEIGNNRDVGGKDFHSVRIFASIDGRDFKPATLTPQERQDDRSFINIRNGPSRNYQFDRADDRPEFMKNCDDKAARCLVLMSHKGWSINVMMAKRQYLGEYKKHCASISAFLDSVTVRIDPIY